MMFYQSFWETLTPKPPFPADSVLGAIWFETRPGWLVAPGSQADELVLPQLDFPQGVIVLADPPPPEPAKRRQKPPVVVQKLPIVVHETGLRVVPADPPRQAMSPRERLVARVGFPKEELYE